MSMKPSSIVAGLIDVITRLQGFEHAAQKRIHRTVVQTRKYIITAVLQAALLSVGALVFLAGAVLFFTRYFAVDMVLLVSGLLIAYVALLVGLAKRK